jgi:hypothetical protein
MVLHQKFENIIATYIQNHPILICLVVGIYEKAFCKWSLKNNLDHKVLFAVNNK